MSKFKIGLFLVGIGTGTLKPSIPAPLSMLNSWVWLVFIAIGFVFIIKGI